MAGPAEAELILDFRITIPAPATETRVVGDLDRLVQVLVNLLSNAVKFSPPAGTVAVEVAERDGYAEVSVRDQGRGVPAHRREAIFERFEQVESSDARQKGGSGLGLAICKAIVEQHGGKIGVSSEPGHGSTFWFRIPSRRTPARVTGRDIWTFYLSHGVYLYCEVLLASLSPARQRLLRERLHQPDDERVVEHAR